MSVRKLGSLAAVAVAIALFFAFDLGRYLSLDWLKAQQAALDAWRDGRPVAAAAVFFILYVAVTALSLPGATLMTLAGGAMFGLWQGILMVSFASSLGATLAFLVSRYLLRDWVASRFGQRVAAIDAGIQRDGSFYLFTLRLVPLFPFFLVNLLLGLTAMKTRSFYWVSQIGMLAGTVVYVNAGTQLAKIESLADIVSPGLLASFAVLGVFPLIARKILGTIHNYRTLAETNKHVAEVWKQAHAPQQLLLLNAPTELSIIVPVLNEASGMVAVLEALTPLRIRGAEVIVVDGGSVDATLELAGPLASHVISAPRGRARQMNAGAALGLGRILLFLHADTRLPGNADEIVSLAVGDGLAGRRWGRFDVRIEGRSIWLRVVARMMNLRSRLTGIATGDQAIFVSGAAFRAVGGFPEIPLMEDIALSKALLRLSRPVCLAARVTTSGRRWEAHGVWRTILFMWWLRLRYFFGADPNRLALEYGDVPRES